MPGRGAGTNRVPIEGRAATTSWGLFLGWLRSRTGIAVGLIWLALLIVAFIVVRPGWVAALLELATASFGLYATSVAFRKDRSAGVVILIALTFSFILLNTALYLPTMFPNPMGR